MVLSSLIIDIAMKKEPLKVLLFSNGAIIPHSKSKYFLSLKQLYTKNLKIQNMKLFLFYNVF